jgi:transposase
MAEYIEGTPREQLYLFKGCLDDMVGGNNLVRFIDTYVESLDMSELGFQMNKAVMGAPAYRPQMKLKIYMYGYFEKIRSSRKLEKECGRNREMMWLTEGLAPDFKTIADFRKENQKAIRLIFKNFIKSCFKAGLISFDIGGIDGTKISAQNHNNNVYQRKNMDKIIAVIDRKIGEYLKEMEDNDKQASGEFEFLSVNLEERLKKLKTNKAKAEMIKKIFEANPEMEKYYANDPESRFMNDKGKLDVSYNVQAAVDGKSKLIVAVDVTSESNDVKQLKGMCDRVEEIKQYLKVEQETIKVADAGYYSEPQILECSDNDHEVYMPNPDDEYLKRNKGIDDRRKIPQREYYADRFAYDPERDVYICPEQQVLIRQGKGFMLKSGKAVNWYFCRECGNCKVRGKCTSNKKGRFLSIAVRKTEIESFKKKVRSTLGKKIIAKRKEICEHPFGTLKRNLGYSYFLMKGREKALTEACLMGLIYNMKRALNIWGKRSFLEAIGAN